MSDPSQSKTKVMAEKTFASMPDSQPNSTNPDAALQEVPQEESELRPVIDDEARAPVDEAAKALALAIAEAADDRKAGNITILQTGDVSYLADYFVIVTGFSNVQVRAIANSIEGAIEDEFDRVPLRTEGMSEGRWVLQDYGEVIVHIFMPDDRDYYDLEAFWGHAERIPFVPTLAQNALSSSPLK